MSALFRHSLWLDHRGWRGRFIGFVIGGLAVLGQAPLHIWPLTFLALALLFLRLQEAAKTNSPKKSGFSAAFWFALGYFGIGVFWIGSAFIARGPAFIPVMPPMILGLATFLALFWGAAGALFARKKLRGPFAQFAFIGFFTLAELVRGHAFGGFPWNLPGYIFPAGHSFSQAASLWTIYGQTLLVFGLSAALASLFLYQRKVLSGLIVLIGFGGLYGFGTWRLNTAALGVQPDIRLRIVSVPFNQADKFDPEKSFNIVNDFLTQSVADADALKDVTHIIWPEGAVTGLAMDDEYLLAAMGRELSYRLNDNFPVWIFNSLRLEKRPHPETGRVINDYYNASVAVEFDDKGNPAIAGYNDKTRLVPFGEFIPFGKWMESQNVPVISTTLLSISAAPKKTLMTFPKLPVGSSQLCYEIIFPGLTPKPKTKNGPRAQFILNQSNDAWFGKSWGPAQHANIARYRSIEEGLPLIRAASNGQSAVINPYGQIVKEVPQDNAGYIDVALPMAISPSQKSNRTIFFLFLINLLISICCVTLGRVHEGRAP